MATDDVACVVVCDAGPLIHLDEIDALDLLGDFPSVIIPDAVRQELLHHRPAALANIPTVELLQAIHAFSPRVAALSQLFTLHRGEQEALEAADINPGCLLLTDDTAARLAARSLGISVRGTLGILVRAVRRQQRTKEQVLTLLRSLPAQSTLHVRADLLKSFIEEVQSCT
jgi:predicted nucleic acid-binding protein